MESEVPSTATLTTAGSGSCRVGNVGLLVGCFANNNGNRLEYSEKHALIGSLDYERTLSNGWNLNSGLAKQFRSMRFLSPDNLMWLPNFINLDAQVRVSNDKDSVLAYVTSDDRLHTAPGVAGYALETLFQLAVLLTDRTQLQCALPVIFQLQHRRLLMSFSPRRTLAVLGAAACLSATSTGAPPALSAEDLLWSYELAIYAGRGNGDMSFYVDHADADYVGWPPQAAAPFGRTELAAQAKLGAGRSGEKIVLEKNLIRLTDHGRTALVFYTSHRTVRSDGSAVDERFENIHIWQRRGRDWKIVGGMSRPVPAHRESLAVPAPATRPTSPAGR